MQKVIISDAGTGKSYNMELDEAKAKAFIGVSIGKVVDGVAIGLSGYQLEITGGSDKDGFPMREDLPGKVRQKVFLSSGPGYKPKAEGLRRRKMVRGNTITPEIVQINAKVVKKGEKPLEELIAVPKEK